MSAAKFKDIPVFKVGEHIDSAGRKRLWTESDLKQMAEYDPKIRAAGFTIGHPDKSVNEPLKGFAGSFSLKDGVLYCKPLKVDPAFAEQVNNGAYPFVSIRVSKAKDKWQVDDVGFFGSKRTAVRGIGWAEFSQGVEGFAYSGCVSGKEISFMEYDHAMNLMLHRAYSQMFSQIRRYLDDVVGIEEAESYLPRPDLDALSNMIRELEIEAEVERRTMPEGESEGEMFEQKVDPSEVDMDKSAEIEQLKKQLADSEAKFEEFRSQAEQDQQKKLQAEAVAFAESLLRQGKILPPQKNSTVATYLALSKAGTYEFEESKVDPLVDWRSEMENRKPKVNFREFAKGDEDPAEFQDPEEEEEIPFTFAAPAGTRVSQEKMDLDRKAIQFCQKQGWDPMDVNKYLKAIESVGGSR